MPQLIEPTLKVHQSFVAAMRELRSEGRGGDGDRSMLGDEIHQYDPEWEDPGVFRGYLDRLLAAEDERTPWQEGFVGSTSLWYVEGEEYLGRISVRHRLTPFLLEQGGHIGYDVRPSARRRGHATAMLGAVLPYARRLGIASALVTCDENNTASRKVIEACGGLFEDQRGKKLRYWIATD